MPFNKRRAATKKKIEKKPVKKIVKKPKTYYGTETGLRGDQDEDRQIRSQTERNKANFLKYKQHFKKSILAEGFDSGRLNRKDLKDINELFSEFAKNKATMLKKLTKKAKRNKK